MAEDNWFGDILPTDDSPPIFGGDGGGVDVGADPYGGTGDSGMQIDPTTGDVYDRNNQYVGNINDPNFSGTPQGTGGGGGNIMGSLAKLLGLGNNSSALPLLLSALGIGGGAY